MRQADEERRARLCPSTLRASHVLIARRGQKGRPRGFSKRSGSGGGRSRARQPDQAHGALSGLSCGHGHVRHRGQVRAGSSRAKPHDRHDLPVKRAALAQSELASGGSANDRRARVPGQGAGTRMAGAGAERQQGRGRGRAAPARDYMAQGSPGQGAQAGRGFQRSHGKGAGRGIVAREFKGEKSVN